MSLSRRKLKTAGFTLVELLVTISIFVILTGVVLFSQAKFNTTILLTNLAYDTALTVRQAQTYGINIKDFVTTAVDSNGNVINTSNFNPYGVHFDMDATKSFILFADLNQGGVFNGTTLDACITSEGCVNRYNIKSGNAILGLCRSETGPCDLKTLDIVFKRPNPDAVIKATDQSGNPVSNLSIVAVQLGNPGDASNTKKVVIQSNGLIYIKSN